MLLRRLLSCNCGLFLRLVHTAVWRKGFNSDSAGNGGSRMGSGGLAGDVFLGRINFCLEEKGLSCLSGRERGRVPILFIFLLRGWRRFLSQALDCAGKLL